MFEGGAYGVGVTVTPLEPAPWPDIPPPPGVEVHPTRLGELMPVAARSPAEKGLELERVARVEGQLAAYKVEIAAGLARDRTDDRPPDDDDHLPGISEFFPDELALILNCSRAEATTLAEVALTLVERLPTTWAALADGKLDWPRARALAQELGWPARETEPRLVAEVEAAVLPQAVELSVSRLRALTRKELMRVDAAAADVRRRDAERAANVTLHPAPDGMAELRAFLPAPLAAPVYEAIDSYARMARDDGDRRSLGQLRVGVLADLTLRPWDTSRPPVTAHVSVVAPLPSLTGGSEPGEVAGQPVTAPQLRELLRELDSLCPGGLQPPIDGTLDVAIVDDETGALRAAVTRRELERLVRRGCLDHPDSDCRCPILGRPEPVGRYRPTPPQYRFTRTRDRTCRHPGCRSKAAWADLDHVVPHALGGPTDCANLCCLCRRHHRLKTHAEGWRFVMDADGLLTVTTPSGITRTTRPPGMPRAREPDPAERVVYPDDDPPPF